MYYNRHRSNTSLYVIITLFVLLLVILWGQGYIG